MTEILTQPNDVAHFQEHHQDDGKTAVCMGEHEGECSVATEVRGDYSEEERQQLITSVEQSLRAIDEFTGGEASKLFAGLHIVVGQDFTDMKNNDGKQIEGLRGGEAVSRENRVLLNGRDLLMSFAKLRETVPDGYADVGQSDALDESAPGSALQYVLVHEIGHILDELTKAGDPMHRVPASESPTKYGREPDEHSSEKDHEAFAEGFAHMVWGMPVSDAMKTAVEETLTARRIETVWA
jgi:hypothetical protein